jgi:hypothetical protein
VNFPCRKSGFSAVRCATASILFSCLLAVAVCVSAQKVPPPPKPANEGPSLEVTMKFIQDKLNGLGPINYDYQWTNTATGLTQRARHLTDEWTEVEADPKTCVLRGHVKEIMNGKVRWDRDVSYRVRAIQKILVMNLEQQQNQNHATAGLSDSARVSPPIFVIEVDLESFPARLYWDPNSGKDHGFFFLYEEEMANRVAKALVHAVELCGGGGKPEPF